MTRALVTLFNLSKRFGCNVCPLEFAMFHAVYDRRHNAKPFNESMVKGTDHENCECQGYSWAPATLRSPEFSMGQQIFPQKKL
jgi:hypothetical protein